MWVFANGYRFWVFLWFGVGGVGFFAQRGGPRFFPGRPPASFKACQKIGSRVRLVEWPWMVRLYLRGPDPGRSVAINTCAGRR